MSQVSDAGEELFTQLVAWELLGRTDLDPKLILRQASLADLSVIQSNIKSRGLVEERSVSVFLVGLELRYRLGHLDGDWELKRNGKEVALSVRPKEPIKFVQVKLEV